jgi:hypothetical protein
MDEFLFAMKSVLPEYQLVDLSGVGTSNRPAREWYDGGWQYKQTNTYDVFIATVDMLCSSVVNLFLMRTFRGKLVYFSGEDRKDPLSMKENMHYFGPVENGTNRDHRIYYFQFVWWHKFQNVLPPEALVDGAKRPIGLQENFVIYAASNCVGYRDEAFSQLSKLGEVHYAGRCKGNVENENHTKINYKIPRYSWWTNINLYEVFRFCLVMEHTGDHQGYITEKILMAFMAGCIPIYYGPRSVFDVFNEHSFVFYDINNPEPAIKLVAELENKRYKYDLMIRQPILVKGNMTLEKYFSFNDTIGNGALKIELRRKLGLLNFTP